MGAPSTEWRESAPAGEEATHVGYAESLRAIQRSRAVDGVAGRALHAKANAGVEGELTVLDELPDPARAGLFARPATYRAYVRFSNGDGRRRADGAGDVRGMAVKVVGVEGTKIIPGMEQAKTQDFLLIRTPALPFRNADEFVAVVTAAQQSPLLVLPRVIARLGLARTLELLPRVAKALRAPTLPLAEGTYFSASPVRCGAYAIHYAFTPHDEPGRADRPGASPERLHHELDARLARGPVVYDLRIQFYTDETKTPIEDASVEWKVEDAPFVTVARLTLPRQDLDGARGKRVAEFVETLSFDPWHALEAHRPLGNIMRARNQAYRLSTKERAAAGEPDGSERFT
jgi:hypothetical protein